MNQEEKLDKISVQVQQMHSVIFGVEGQGGLLRAIETLQSELETMKRFRWQMLGMGTIIGVLISALLNHK
jgi:hypothetical protein